MTDSTVAITVTYYAMKITAICSLISSYFCDTKYCNIA